MASCIIPIISVGIFTYDALATQSTGPEDRYVNTGEAQMQLDPLGDAEDARNQCRYGA